ncbi:MAG: UDP-3-O-acyl-N-acetylglucosamine deacetylase [Alphaproteobacteria bacterium]|nr:UDP-3-O-acyl-N-acetylglucosamine deacetylase [Alphaproteobacteria bacterium]
MAETIAQAQAVAIARARQLSPNGTERRRATLQRTLKSAIHCTGVGLHSGARTSMTLKPAEAGSGIVFVRTDVLCAGCDPVAATLPAMWHSVSDTRMCTTLSNAAGTKLSTVEHLMAAVAGCEIDNLLIEIDGPEVPIMDGSAGPFVFLIECAGTIEQDTPRRAIEVLRPVSVGDDTRAASLVPADGFSLSFMIDFDSKAISRQECGLTFDPAAFRAEIARARTFGFAHEIDQLRAAGLARGGSLDNAVVIAGDRVLNHDGLRYEDEFVRHKVLDAVGDLALAGAPIIGHYHGVRAGHSFNNKLLQALFADEAAWRWAMLDGRTAGAAPWQRRAVAANA